ncbi:MAG: dockerin type I domain-containing protein [Candidatus Bathyarchaeota archaeon]
MIHRLIKRNKIGILLTTFLTLSILFSSILLVNADPGGTGKFLTINFVDDEGTTITSGVVDVTKSSGQGFTFDAAYQDLADNTQQMAAGTVKLEAIPDEGWDFIRFEVIEPYTEILPADPADSNVAYFKNVKYGEINAIFEKVVEQYTVTFSSEGPGNYNVNYEGVDDLENPSEVTVDGGTLLNIFFDPDSGYHVSAIVATYFDEFGEFDYVEYITLDLTNTESYSFTVESNMDIHIIFEVDGIAFVPANSNNVNVFLSSQVGVEGINTNQYNSFFAGADLLGNTNLFFETDIIVWQINTNVTVTDDGVVVVFHYEDEDIPDKNNDGQINELDELLLKLWKTPSLVGDVNNDGIVNGKDDSIVANAVNTNQQPGWYDPFLDVNNDGYVDNEDLNLINQNKGNTIDLSAEIDVTGYVDPVYNLIYSISLTGDNFSIFRCR